MQNKIPIVLAFDDGFWAPAYATMRSVCLFSKRRRDIVFHLCCRGLSPSHRAVLTGIEREFDAAIAWHDLDGDPAFNAAVDGLTSNRRLSKIIFARLMLDQFVSGQANRAIYLDCDVMVREPVERLIGLSLEGKAIGAVRDPMFPFCSMGRDIKNNADLFDPAQRYFNSGVLLIDLERWRQACVWSRLEAMIADGTLARIYYDQDALNIIFRENWHELDYRWNLIDPRPPHQALDPYILHYTGERKPWNIVSGVAFARLYRHVMTNEVFYAFWRERMGRRWKKALPMGDR